MACVGVLFVLRYQTKVCDGCHNMTQTSMGFDDFVVVTVGRKEKHRPWLNSKGTVAKTKNKCPKKDRRYYKENKEKVEENGSWSIQGIVWRTKKKIRK